MPKERYYQSSKDRMDEKMGMERKEEKGMERKMRGSMEKEYKNKYEDKKREFYVGYDARKRMELEDSGMIREDRNATANLPQNVIMKDYYKGNNYGYEVGLDDTVSGVDRQMKEDARGMKRSEYPEKY
jgi:hypothetical protein